MRKTKITIQLHTFVFIYLSTFSTNSSLYYIGEYELARKGNDIIINLNDYFNLDSCKGKLTTFFPVLFSAVTHLQGRLMKNMVYVLGLHSTKNQ